VLGITTGTLVHITAAAAGLSALIVSSRAAFDGVRYAGAAYLIVIGLLRIARRTEDDAPAARPTSELRRAYTRGVVVNVLNPKTALFFLAFLPQFVDASRGRAWLQIVVLGLSFALLGMLSDGAYAVLAGTVADRLRGSRRFELVQRWIPGSLFVGLGVFAAART
jgi:threonine/homoserine/homoserine lactone efflux protein